MNLEKKSASLTENVKKNIDELLDSYVEREKVIKLEAEAAQKNTKDIVAKAIATEKSAIERSIKIVEKAEGDAKLLMTKAEKEKREWESEKNNIAKTYHFDNNEIKLDIGGLSFTTTLTTLTRFPTTMLGAMFSGRHPLKKNDAGAYFVDRDGLHFRHILNFLRNPESWKLNLEANLKEELKCEAEFYGLCNLMFPFIPAEPVSVIGDQDTELLVTQNEEGIWYMECETFESPPTAVTYCHSCNIGWIPVSQYNCLEYVESFNTGREILPTQPTHSPQAPCPWCNRK